MVVCKQTNDAVPTMETHLENTVLGERERHAITGSSSPKPCVVVASDSDISTTVHTSPSESPVRSDTSALGSLSPVELAIEFLISKEVLGGDIHRNEFH
jgi:hypothetical protein